jgi:DNA-binding transcriptional ArsR family regulator
MDEETVLPAARFELATFGELVGDPSRSAMLLGLMAGEARPAGELAALAGVSPATASFHLQRLLAGGLVVQELLGRHRYYRLGSEQVGEALEAALLLTPGPRPARPPSPERARLAEARTCYRHLAGVLGVELLACLSRRRFLGLREGGLALTDEGAAWFAAQGLRQERFPPGRPCLDWTERKPHLGGPLGVLLTGHLFARGWIARRDDGRAVRVTSSGRRSFAALGVAAAVG